MHFVTFWVIRSRENFENERKFYAIEKIIEMKLFAKGTHLFLFSCKRRCDHCDHSKKQGRENFPKKMALFLDKNLQNITREKFF